MKKSALSVTFATITMSLIGGFVYLVSKWPEIMLVVACSFIFVVLVYMFYQMLDR